MQDNTLQIARNEKYMQAHEQTKEKVDKILDTLSNTPINEVQEIIRIAQSQIFDFTKKATKDILFN